MIIASAAGEKRDIKVVSIQHHPPREYVHYITLISLSAGEQHPLRKNRKLEFGLVFHNKLSRGNLEEGSFGAQCLVFRSTATFMQTQDPS